MPTNSLHTAFKSGPDAAAEQLNIIAASPEFLEDEDDSWEGWLPLHNASRWGASKAAVSAALAAYPDAAKVSSKGGYEPLHLCSMGGHVEAVEAIVEVYPEGALKKDNHGRTPLDEAREGSSPAHERIVDLLLSLPGVREAEAAEQELRAAHAALLMRPDDEEEEDDGNDNEELADADGGGGLKGYKDHGRAVMGSVVAGAAYTAAVQQQQRQAAAQAAAQHAASAAAEAGEDGMDESGDGDDGESSSLYNIGARQLASRMFRAASSALWRSEPEASESDMAQVHQFFSERAKYIPLRLELRERRYLRLLEGVLHVSEYTDKVDSAAISAAPAKRKQAMRRELHSILSGLLLSCDYEAGQTAMAERSYSDYPEFFAPLFEVTRRYKVMNPEKMRETYGKLVYLLQDANTPEMQVRSHSPSSQAKQSPNSHSQAASLTAPSLFPAPHAGRARLPISCADTDSSRQAQGVQRVGDAQRRFDGCGDTSRDPRPRQEPEPDTARDQTKGARHRVSCAAVQVSSSQAKPSTAIPSTHSPPPSLPTIHLPTGRASCRRRSSSSVYTPSATTTPICTRRAIRSTR